MTSKTPPPEQTGTGPPSPAPKAVSQNTRVKLPGENLDQKRPASHDREPPPTTGENQNHTNLDSLTIEEAITTLNNPIQAAQVFHIARGPKVQCPKCSHRRDTHQIINKPGAYRCGNCKSLFSIKTNTAMADPSTRLTTWALAVYLIVKDPNHYRGHTLAASLSITATPAARIEQTIRELINGPSNTIQVMASLATLKTFTPKPQDQYLKEPPHTKDGTTPQHSRRRPYWETPGEEPSPSRTEMIYSNRCPHCGATGSINDNIGRRCIMCSKPPNQAPTVQDNTILPRPGTRAFKLDSPQK